MQKFRYIGEWPEGESEVRAYGVIFRPGAAVEVPEPFVRKALNNPAFAVVEDDEPVKSVVESEAQAGDSVVGLSKADLLREAEKHGVQVDKRWSATRIAEAIIAHAKQQQ